MSSTKVTTVNRVLSSAANEDLQSKPLPKPICWHEGMLLSPHHFQQNQQYWESQLSRMISVLSPHFWGISELRLDYAALLEGEVIVERLVAIMPDGLMVDYDSNIEEPLTVSLEELDVKPVTVQVVVPISVPGSASERSEIQRYYSKDDNPRIDENTGDNEMVIPRLVPKLSLQVTDRVGNRYVGLPLFRVVKPEGGSIQMDANYCPPLLSIRADQFRAGNDDMPGSKPIQQQAKALALSIRHKAMQLAGMTDEGESLGKNIGQRHHRWIRAMVQDLVIFEQVANSPDSSPRALYDALVRMTGPMSELSPSSIPPQFEAYNHDDHLPAFTRGLMYMQSLIDSVNLNYTTMSFDQERDGVFTLMMDEAWEDKDLIIELRPNNNGSRESLNTWLKACRIASINLHKDLAERRLLGAKAEPIDREDKSGIVPAAGNALFRIHVEKRYITTGSKLVIVATGSKIKEYAPQTILVHMPHDA